MPGKDVTLEIKLLEEKVTETKITVSNADFEKENYIFLEEWKDIRDEIKRRVEQRNYMTEVMAVIVAALITAAATTVNSYFFLGILPFLTIFFMLLIKASYNRHRCLTNHLKQIEQEIIKITPNIRSEAFWELSFTETQKTNRQRAYNMFSVGTFFVCFSFFAYYAHNLQIGFLTQSIIDALLVVYFIVAIIGIAYAWVNENDIQDNKIDSLTNLPIINRGESLVGEAICRAANFESSSSVAKVSIGSLIVTTQKIIYVKKSSIFPSLFQCEYNTNLQDITSLVLQDGNETLVVETKGGASLKFTNYFFGKHVSELFRLINAEKSNGETEKT